MNRTVISISLLVCSALVVIASHKPVDACMKPPLAYKGYTLDGLKPPCSSDDIFLPMLDVYNDQPTDEHLKYYPGGTGFGHYSIWMVSLPNVGQSCDSNLILKEGSSDSSLALLITKSGQIYYFREGVGISEIPFGVRVIVDQGRRWLAVDNDLAVLDRGQLDSSTEHVFWATTSSDSKDLQERFAVSAETEWNRWTIYTEWDEILYDCHEDQRNNEDVDARNGSHNPAQPSESDETDSTIEQDNAVVHGSPSRDSQEDADQPACNTNGSDDLPSPEWLLFVASILLWVMARTTRSLDKTRLANK